MAIEKLSIQEIDKLKARIYRKFFNNNKDFYKNNAQKFHNQQTKYYDQKILECCRLSIEDIRKHLTDPAYSDWP